MTEAERLQSRIDVLAEMLAGLQQTKAKPMTKKYFTLIAREPDGQWSPQFGDYDRQTVEAEKMDYIDHIGTTWAKGTKFKIVTSNDTQASINAAIAALNI